MTDIAEMHRWLDALIGHDGVLEVCDLDRCPSVAKVCETALARWVAQCHADDEDRARQIAAEVATLAYHLADLTEAREMPQFLWAAALGRTMAYEVPRIPPPPST